MSARSRPTEAPFEFALRREEILRRGPDESERVVSGALSPRRYELALLLAERTLAGASDRVGDLRLRLSGAPPPARVKEELRHLQAFGFATPTDRGGWQVAGGAAGVPVSGADLRRARDRLAARLGDDRRLGLSESSTAATLREEFHAIEAAFEREEHGEVARRIEAKVGTSGFLAALNRALSPRKREEARCLLHTFGGMAAMNLGRLADASHHLDLAEQDAHALRGPNAIWRVRLAATRAAVARMGAAQASDLPERRDLLRAAVEAWDRVEHLAGAPTIDLDDADRHESLRWAQVERATPLSLLADLAMGEGAAGGEVQSLLERARQGVGDGSDLLGKYRADPGAVVSTALIEGRLALSLDEVADAAETLGEAEELALMPSTPRWVAGWVPRYLADLSFAEGQPRGVVGRYLRDAWLQNRTHRFQRMLLLARVGGFGVGVDELDDLAVEAEMTRLMHELHLTRRGVAVDQCSSCAVRDPSLTRRVLGRRIRCALGMHPEPVRKVQELGVWR